MRTAKCPMCQGERFYRGNLTSYGLLRIDLTSFFSFGFRKLVPVGCRVCVSCGYVAPYVDHDGLVAIRKKRKSKVIEIDEEAGVKQLREL